MIEVLQYTKERFGDKECLIETPIGVMDGKYVETDILPVEEVSIAHRGPEYGISVLFLI